MHAVLIQSDTLDLIATNNGGLKPDVEAWGGYFILPTDPNDHAEIVSAEDFERDYEFVEEQGVTRFEMVVPSGPEICPRCGGDHSWCQSVQPGEFG